MKKKAETYVVTNKATSSTGIKLWCLERNNWDEGRGWIIAFLLP